MRGGTMSDREFLTYDKAVAMLPDGDTIHTFRSSIPGVIIGADWERENLLEAIKIHNPELSGNQAAAMNHGLIIIDQHGPLFIETKPGKTP
jgi:hypothetical protein